MGISDELKRRLRNIELEQKRQELALKRLSDFEEKIRELEAQLKLIDGFQVTLREQVDYSQLRNLDETQRIEAELKQMEQEYHARDFNELRYFEEIAELRAKLNGEITSLKAKREKLLDSHREVIPLDKIVEISSSSGTTAPHSSEELNQFAIRLRETDYEAESPFEEQYFAEIQQLRKSVSKETVAAPRPASTKTLSQTQSKTAQPPPNKKQPKRQSGYVICLMLNPNAPTEWSGELESGGGWREPGKGTCYPDAEQVKRCLRSLKKQWPTYPLKVIKRV